jgi:hypothetical protein
MQDLHARIDALTDADLVEASGYYLARVLEIESLGDAHARLVKTCRLNGGDVLSLEAIQEEIVADRDAYRELLLLLLHAGTEGEQHQLVELAVAGAGQKQVVADVGLVLVLGSLAYITYVLRTGGKQSEERTFKLEETADGGFTCEMKTKTIYANPSSSLGRFLGWLKALPTGGKS